MFKALNNHQRQGLIDLLTFISSDEEVLDIQWAAYMLATCKHETADTYLPIAEYGLGKGKEYGKIDPVTNRAYYGRGFVQLTWSTNYKAMSKIVGVDLYKDPDTAMIPDVAYKIMSYGMRNGSFTGVSLKHYLRNDKKDYVNARKIINGMDCAERIAGYALKFETTLRECI